MKKYLLIFLLSPLFTFTTIAQEKLTLQQAIHTALEKNISVISARNAMEIQRSGVLVEYGRLLPMVSASARWGRGGSTVSSTTLATGSTAASIDASVSLANGLSNIYSIDKAKNEAGSSEYDYQQSRQAIALAAFGAYTNVLKTKQLLKVSEDNLKRSRQQLSRIEESNKVGAVAKADLYRQQVQTATDELAVINAQNDYDNARYNLLYLLSLDVTKEYTIEDDSIMQAVEKADSIAQQDTYDYAKLVEEALAARPDYQSLLLKRDAAANALTISQLGHYPSLSLDGRYGYGTVGGSDFSNFQNKSDWNLAFTVRVPIFSGFQVSSAVQTSQLNYELAVQNLEQKRREVQKNISTDLLNLEATKKRLEVSLKSVASAAEDFRIAEERYNLGSNTLLDLLVATANYTTAISNKVNASYDYLYAKQQLKISIGKDRY